MFIWGRRGRVCHKIHNLKINVHKKAKWGHFSTYLVVPLNSPKVNQEPLFAKESVPNQAGPVGLCGRACLFSAPSCFSGDTSRCQDTRRKCLSLPSCSTHGGRETCSFSNAAASWRYAYCVPDTILRASDPWLTESSQHYEVTAITPFYQHEHWDSETSNLVSGSRISIHVYLTLTLLSIILCFLLTIKKIYQLLKRYIIRTPRKEPFNSPGGRKDQGRLPGRDDIWVKLWKMTKNLPECGTQPDKVDVL